MDAFKIKILRCLILDWRMLCGYSARGGHANDIPSKRQFVEENYQSLVNQRNECDSWKEFYISYQYQ